ncbi:carboxylesterase/lipase family protein [Homoserinibacter sp. GY 40078]|nr:carboxylesterase/lipase family protein [Homoserinibacter sp. GY 40078]
MTTGALAGRERDGIRRFLGIPYAKPPFDERRFAAPEPADAWEGVRDATRFGATAPQPPYGGDIAELLNSVVIEGDDILTVNVWAPADAANAPVVLWLHGGALERGSSAQSGYDGSTFAREGIVFVSANYRLGIEGFSVLEGSPLNLGLLDAALALEWVHREVAAFGGDRSHITLMGESAGGLLVAALASRPDSRELIVGAIIESGPLDADPPKRAGRASAAIAQHLGIRPTREAFSAVPPQDLIRARAELNRGGSLLSGSTASFSLALDPATLPQAPRDALVDFPHPILIGTNTDEYRIWFRPESLEKIRGLTAVAGRLALRISARAAREARAAFPDANPGEVLGQLLGEKLVRAPATRLARTRRTPTYVYEFAWQSPVRDLRAAHAVELGFVFDALDTDDAVALGGTDAPADLAREMHAAWVRFIRTGDPGWPRFDTDRITQVWDTTSRAMPQRRQGLVDALG